LLPVPLLLLPLDPGLREELPEPDVPPVELPLVPLPVADEPLVLPLPALPFLSHPVTRVPATASAKTTVMICFMGCLLSGA
jgi:hypothetical protein